jgi:ABC-2 type transport system ATP-binding protein
VTSHAARPGAMTPADPAPAIAVAGLTRKYRAQLALDDVSFTVPGGTITGLLGRNGAGKTTLLRVVAGQEFPSSGSVRVLGAPPTENEAVLRRMILIREDQAYPGDMKVRQALRAASWCCPNWDADLAASLVDGFGLRRDRAVKQLSRGQRSALGITIGLAARAEVTLFDEPYAGLDAVARQIFYDRLLADFAAHPRTVVLSTHLIDEAAAMFENVIVIDHGRVVLDGPADGLRGIVTRVSGPCLAVDALVEGRPVWERRRLGSQSSVVIVGPLSAGDREQARAAGLDLTPLSLQEIVVRAAGWQAGGVPEPDPDASFETERTSA